ncbi:MAG: MotA/TolQ/ExbB proton channel family protein [Magnetococcales bacterium]|nr:MotA/TolQ/ExbB proton channel family protein [Magnetococcales bacterium]
MLDLLAEVRFFLDSGGPVLWAIGLLSSLMTALIIERYWFFRHHSQCHVTAMVVQWNERQDRGSWTALRIRDALIADVAANLSKNLAVIKVLVKLCPLFGLLGTVTGMISVFDVIALFGTGNPRTMATGISHATIPTMAGMMIMLPGLYFCHGLHQEMNRRIEQISHQLTIN